MLEARRRARQQEQEEALAKELERRTREEEGRRLAVQRICDEDPSLRELQSKLRLAYVAKERLGQLEEKREVVARSKEEQAAEDRRLEEARRAAIAADAAREEQAKAAREAAARQLQQQLHDKVRAPRTACVVVRPSLLTTAPAHPSAASARLHRRAGGRRARAQHGRRHPVADPRGG